LAPIIPLSWGWSYGSHVVVGASSDVLRAAPIGILFTLVGRQGYLESPAL
jgi:hypothetical protein